MCRTGGVGGSFRAHTMGSCANFTRDPSIQPARQSRCTYENPGGQSQLKERNESLQVPPLKQGLPAHSLTLVSQFLPVKPLVQLQR